MSGNDDEEDRTRRRVPRRGRVTLKWAAPPLGLPGEPERETRDDDSAELALPEAEVEAEADPVPPADAEAPASDAWDRDRPRLTPPPFRPPSALPEATDGDGGALELVDRRSRVGAGTGDLVEEMGDRHALGDYTAALRLAELVLGRDPDHPAAGRVAESSRERLAHIYTSRLGSLERTVRPGVEGSAVRWLGLDHRTALLLSRIDPGRKLSEVVDHGGLPRLDALKALVELLDRGAIRLDD